MLEALNLVVELSDGGQVGKDLIKRRLKKAYRQGRLAEIPMGNPEQHAEWMYRLCCANLMLGNFTWEGFEHRADWARMLWYRPDAFGIPLWKGQKVKKLLLLGEQGVGDEVMFSSIIPDVLKVADEVELICTDRLVSVFERSFGIKCYPRTEGKELKNAKEVINGHEAYFGLGDLGRLFRRKRADFPGLAYITPDPARIPEMEPYKGAAGISWRGRNGQYKLGEFPKGLSLQYDPWWDEEVETPDIDLKNDIEGVLALLSVLDKVVTVSTSVAHFAGALGVKTDVILAPWQTGTAKSQLNWRWLRDSKKSYWYGNTTVYRNLSEWRAHN